MFGALSLFNHAAFDLKIYTEINILGEKLQMELKLIAK